MCGCNGNINREVKTSNQIALEEMQRQQAAEEANKTSTNAAVANSNA